jgi:hypothetical protein
LVTPGLRPAPGLAPPLAIENIEKQSRYRLDCTASYRGRQLMMEISGSLMVRVLEHLIMSIVISSKWLIVLVASALALMLLVYFTRQLIRLRPVQPEEYPNSMYAELNDILRQGGVDDKTREAALAVLDRHVFERSPYRQRRDENSDAAVILQDQVSANTDRFFATIAGVGGIAGIVLTLFSRTEIFNSVWKGLFGWIFTSAYAAVDDRKADVSFLVPYFLSTILAIMAVSFIGSVYVALTTTNTRSNSGRRKTADNIIKMAGSFFVGFGMALMKY